MPAGAIQWSQMNVKNAAGRAFHAMYAKVEDAALKTARLTSNGVFNPQECKISAN